MKFKFLRWFIILLISSVALLSAGIFITYQKRKHSVKRSKLQFDIKKNQIKKVVLENGMTVLVFQNKQVPKVLVQIAYDVGSAVEESGEQGLAHLLEHMIFKGTDKLNEGDIDSIARKYGASFNAFTAKDITSYYFEANKNNWQPFVGILADCMQNARFDDQHLASELKAVIQEMRMLKDNHSNLMFDKASELSYQSNHPYHHPIIGYQEDLVAVTGKKLKDFYKKYYAPNKATLFVVGDVDIDEVIALAKKSFESIPKGADYVRRSFPDAGISLVTHETQIFEEVQKKLIGFYWKIPGLKGGNEVLTSVVEEILGEGEGSILYRTLVDNEKVATSVGVGCWPMFSSSLFFIFVEPMDGKVDRCKELIQLELEGIIQKGVDEDCLQKIVRSNERAFLNLLESASSLTYEWINSYFTTGNEFDLFEKLDEYYKINENAVQEFVKTYLDPKLMNSVYLLPLSEEQKKTWLENKERSDKLDQEILKKHERTASVEEPKFIKSMSEPRELAFSFPKPTSDFLLSNGFRVLLKEHGVLPLIYTACRFKDASFLARSKEGLGVSMMMSMLIEGSKGYSKQDNVDFFENLGIAYAFDAVGARFSMVNVDCQEAFKRLLHILTQPEFEQNAFEKVKAIFIDAYERSKDSPQAVAVRLFKQAVYKDHPYGWSIDEGIEYIKNLSINDLYELHKKYMFPGGMILSIAGEFDLEGMKKTVDNIFGEWHGDVSCGLSVETLVKTDDFIPGAEINHSMLRDQVVLLFGRPSVINMYHPDYVPLQLLNFIGFHSLGSRLYELRERTGLFYNAMGGFGEGVSKVSGFDYIFALLSVDKLTGAETSMKALVEKMGKEGISEEELAAARQWYLKGLIDLIANNKAIASTLGYLTEYDLGFDYYDKVLKRVQTISVKELNDICRKYFTTDGMVRVRVGRV